MLFRSKASNSCGLSSVKVLAINNIVCPRTGQTGTMSMVAYPNPTHELLNVEFTSENNENAIIRLVDAAGRVVYSDSIDATEGANSAAINVSSFAKGVYLLQLESSNHLEKIRVIVE